MDKNLAAFDDGHSLVMEKLGDVEIDTLPAPGKKDQMFLLGNEACALGAIAAGSRFMASYPITPASEVMEYMIKNMDKLGATIVQTEDEIAACMRRCSWFHLYFWSWSILDGRILVYGIHGRTSYGCYRRTTFRPIHRYGYKGRTIRY